MLKVLPTTILIAWANILIAQTAIDSLKKSLYSNISTYQKVIIYDEIGYQLSSSNPSIALEYADSAINMALELNDPELLAKSYNGKSIPLIRLGQFGSAIEVLEKALTHNESTGNTRREGAILTKIGVAYQEQNNIEFAQEYYLNAAVIFDSLKDSLAIAQVYDNLAAVYERLNDFEKSIKYNKLSLPILKAFNFKYGLAVNYGNQSILFRKKEQFDSALFYIDLSIKLLTEINALEEKSTALINKGILLKQTNRWDEALASQKAALAIAIDLKDSANIAYSLLDIGSLQYDIQDYDNAEKSFSQALEISDKLQIDRVALQAHDGLLTIFIKASKSELALYHKNQFFQLKDSTYNVSREKAIRELETQYDTEKKEQQIALQEAQLSEQKAQLDRNRFLTIALIVTVISIVALWLLNRSRLKKKQLLQLQQEKLHTKEVEINATISSQEKERARYARDLHDGFGQMISILNMNLGSLQNHAKSDERQKVYQESEKVISEMYNELKAICFDLMPQTLIKNGLQSGLEEFAERINKAGKVFIETNFFGLEERLFEIQEISFYRITQEWVNNILKYSDANQITLQITKDEKEITLLIEDNGSGFDKSLLTSSKGNGWKNLNTRVSLISGTLELETEVGKKANTLIVNAPAILNTYESEGNNRMILDRE